MAALLYLLHGMLALQLTTLSPSNYYTALMLMQSLMSLSLRPPYMHCWYN